MPNEVEWAVNFEQLKPEPRHRFPRVVTVFKLPMSTDRHGGTKISTHEYVEIFTTGLSETLTVQVRVDKGSYWVLSRETFRVPLVAEADFDNQRLVEVIADGVVTQEELLLAQSALQPLIDSTRYLLQTTF